IADASLELRFEHTSNKKMLKQAWQLNNFINKSELNGLLTHPLSSALNILQTKKCSSKLGN
ncbi:hypothetical protein, partial [Winogradskyella algicola]|uniref:hypothetical protein n=1 Tax=Winogradskyella algicola TaxID=2575815 RepID=UPI001BB27CC6